jgi:hypothetical protein
MTNKQEYKTFFKTLASRMRALLNLQENVEGEKYQECVIRLSELEKIRDMMMVSFQNETPEFDFEKANEYFAKLIKFDVKGDK